MKTKTILLFCLLVITSAYSQSMDGYPSIQNTHLKLNFLPDDGLLILHVLNENSSIYYTANTDGIFLDNEKQTDFKVVSRSPLILENKSIQIHFRKLNDQSISMEISPKDSRSHDFKFILRSDDQSEYYGMGERFNSVNERGYILPNITDDRAGVKGVGTHKPIPFFMSNHGFGVWVDNFTPGVFDLNGSERYQVRIKFHDKNLKVVFIGGKKLTEILTGFTELTGRSIVPPPWAFGLWKSRDVHHNQDSVYTDIEKLRKYKIPASVLVLDSPWETGYNNFLVNQEQFNNPDSMFKRINKLGFNLCLWLTPFINNDDIIDMKGIRKVSSNFSEAAEKGFLIKRKNGDVAISEWWKGKGGLVDLTNPEAVEWWQNQMKSMLNYNVKAFKCDDGEGNFVPDAQFHNGSSAYEMKNHYSVLYDSVMQDFVNKYLNGDGVLITRSGYTGFQKYPLAWGGDNDADFGFANGLPSVIIAAQTSAMSGISLWGSDIAGYVGKPTKELFIRWTQFSTFTPFMQVHMQSNLGPWDFGDETLNIFRKFAVLRMQLFPYLYNLAFETAATGIPVIRPMALAYQNDNEAKKNEYQFMFGPDFLIAPVYKPGNHRAVYLPEGNWIDFWSGNMIEGKKYIEADAPLDKIPMYVQAGSIIPMLPGDIETLVPRNPQMDSNLKSMDDRRILEVWPGSTGSMKTWEGISATLSQSGKTHHLDFSSKTERPLKIEIMYKKIDNLHINNADVSYDKLNNKTIISFEKFKGSSSIQWDDNN